MCLKTRFAAAGLVLGAFVSQALCWEAVSSFVGSTWGNPNSTSWAGNTPVVIDQYQEECDQTNGSVLYACVTIRLNQASLRRDVIVIHYPLDARLANLTSVLKQAYYSGKKLKVLGNNSRALVSADMSYSWQGYVNTNVYRVYPGDKVAITVQ